MPILDDHGCDWLLIERWHRWTCAVGWDGRWEDYERNRAAVRELGFDDCGWRVWIHDLMAWKDTT